MLLGTMARTYRRSSLEAIVDQACADGMKAMQLNLANAGLESLPASLDEPVARRIGDVFRDRGLHLAAVGGTFNAVHPAKEERSEGVRRVGLIARQAQAFGADTLTLCTGTRNPDYMWGFHPDNSRPDAWTDMIDTFKRLIDVTEGSGVMLVFEPEVVNVVDTSEKARRLLDEVASPRLKVLIDPANLINHENIGDTTSVIENAFRLLAADIHMAHAKDIVPAEPGADHPRRVAPGTGRIDWPCYLRLLVENGFTGSLIMHDLDEEEVVACRDRLTALAPRGAF